ncbi:MAG: hypothetical protein AAFP76_01350 [Bacteroidota bacterium]
MNANRTNYRSQFPKAFFVFLFLLGSIFNLSGQTEELWFGTYTDDQNKVQQGRFKITTEGKAIKKLILQPYGQRTMEFKIMKSDTVRNFVEMSWPEKPNRVGTLIWYNHGYYAGNFEDGTKVLPMVLKKFNFQDAQLQGNWFKPSAIEVKILQNAKQLISSPAQWNKNDTRVCESDESYSLFCAIYKSSIDIDGEYRHLRPAVKFVRDVIKEKYPQQYEHVLVDFNNAPEIEISELYEVFDLAIEKLNEAIAENNKED